MFCGWGGKDEQVEYHRFFRGVWGHNTHTHVPHTPVTPFHHYLMLSSPPFKIWGSCGKTPRPPSFPNTHTHTANTVGQCSPLGGLPRWKEEWWRGLEEQMKQMRWPRSSSFLSALAYIYINVTASDKVPLLHNFKYTTLDISSWIVLFGSPVHVLPSCAG